MSIRITTILKHATIYGLALAALLLAVRAMEIRYFLFDHATDAYIGGIAILFTGLGIWLALKLVTPKTRTVIVEKEIIVTVPAVQQSVDSFSINEKALQKLDISNRELEVLQHMAAGLSNQEIADKMFVSLNTIKTHSSNLFMKLDVKRRTQAVDTGRKSGIIA